MADKNSLADLQAENARLTALLNAHGFELVYLHRTNKLRVIIGPVWVCIPPYAATESAVYAPEVVPGETASPRGLITRYPRGPHTWPAISRQLLKFCTWPLQVIL